MTTFAEAARDRFRYDDRGAADTVRTEMARLPRGSLGYADTTTSQGSITTEVDLTSLTVTVLLPAGRRIKVTGFTWMSSTVAGDVVITSIKEGVTELARSSVIAAQAGGGVTGVGKAILTPSAGSHTYKLSAQRVLGTGTATSNASATVKPFVLVEDLGAA